MDPVSHTYVPRLLDIPLAAIVAIWVIVLYCVIIIIILLNQNKRYVVPMIEMCTSHNVNAIEKN